MTRMMHMTTMLNPTTSSKTGYTSVGRGLGCPRQKPSPPRQCVGRRRLVSYNSTRGANKSSSSSRNGSPSSWVNVKVGAGGKRQVGELLAICRWSCIVGTHSKCYSAKGAAAAAASAASSSSSSSSDTQPPPSPRQEDQKEKGLEVNKGLWKGILCNLNRDGSPQELPPQYVPDALREWGETLYEWNTLCETRVEKEGDGNGDVHLIQEVKRQVPLTACESVEAQYEPLVTDDTRDFVCACDSDGNFLLAHEKVKVENEIQSVTLNTCFHLSSTTRVRFDLLVRKFLSNKGSKYHLGASRVLLEERVKDGLGLADFDELDTDGGVRQTNSIANTDRPESFEDEGVQQIGLILNTWLDIYEGEDLRIELTIPKTRMKEEQKFTVKYSNMSLTEASLS